MNTIFISLDGSGSMHTKKNETVLAINEYINDIKQTISMDETKLIIVVWDSERYDYIYNGPMSLFGELKSSQYMTKGWTPLWDSFCKAIKELSNIGGKKMLIIMTDGEENYSKTYTKEHVKAMIDGFTGFGNEIVFLGNDFDVTKTGEDIGTKSGQTISFDVGEARSAMSSVYNITSSYFTEND